jgi:hypothetical protein
MSFEHDLQELHGWHAMVYTDKAVVLRPRVLLACSPVEGNNDVNTEFTTA